MPATHVSGQQYAYVFDHEQDFPRFHSDRRCPERYTSDMTESAAVRATIDGEMRPCEECCEEFPLRVYAGPTARVPLACGGHVTIETERLAVHETDDLHRAVRRVLRDRNLI